MISPTLNRSLRESTPSQAAARLRLELQAHAIDNSTSELTAHLFNAVKTGALPPQLVVPYFKTSADPHALVSALRQTYSVTLRQGAIKYLGRALRFESTFSPVWTALGGALGIASLMRELSVDDVKLVCLTLGATAMAPGCRSERQQKMADLYALLCPTDPNADRDARPLRRFYHLLVRACTPEVGRKWLLERRTSLDWVDSNIVRRIQLAHATIYREEDLRDAFSQPDHMLKIKDLQVYMDHDRQFRIRVLKHLATCSPYSLKLDDAHLITTFLLEPIAYNLATDRRRLSSDEQHELWSDILVVLEKWPACAGSTMCNMPTWRSVIKFAADWWAYTGTEEHKGRAGAVFEGIVRCIARNRSLVMDHAGGNLSLKTAVFANPPNQHIALSSLLGLGRNESQKLELLTWLFRHASNCGIDIKSPTPEDKEKLAQLSVEIDEQILRSLPAENAVGILDLLLEAKPGGSFIAAFPKNKQPTVLSRTIASFGHNFGGQNTMTLIDEEEEKGPTHAENVSQLRTQLLQKAGLLPKVEDIETDEERQQRLTKIMDKVQDYLTKSRQSRDPAFRGFWVILALRWAIESGSVELYAETALWARRYDRDHEVSKMLRTKFDATQEPIDLLCGISLAVHPRSHPASLSAATEALEAGNDYVLSTLEHAATSREPRGNKPRSSAIWKETKLAVEVVNRRLRYINNFQRVHDLQDQEVFDLVWRPTLGMLVKSETLALKEGPKSQFPEAAKNFVLTVAPGQTINNHTWQFLDELSKVRDKLWSEAWLERFPTVAESHFWPRGLPIQHLMPIHHNFYMAPPLLYKLPYVMSTAKSVVFGVTTAPASGAVVDNDFALGANITPVTNQACPHKEYEQFMPDLPLCLQLYIMGDNDSDQHGHKQRTQEVWDFFSNMLVSSGVEKDHVIMILRTWLFTHNVVPVGHAFPKITVKQPPLAGLPLVEDPSQPLEWNPTPILSPQSWRDACYFSWKRYPDVFQSRLLQMIPAGARMHMSHYSTHVATDSWVDFVLQPEPPATMTDAKIAAPLSVLYHDHVAGKPFFGEPFPTIDDVRFPSLFLSDDFLEPGGTPRAPEDWRALELLKSVARRVPPDLLLSLASQFFDKVKHGTAKPATFGVYMELIRICILSDRPAIACDLIRHLVLDHQDDSSWHRQFFTAKFFSRLAPAEATLLIQDMTNAILDRLAEQSKFTWEEMSKMENPPPRMKVTVVKMLAEVLRTSRFIETKTAVGSLVKLLRDAKHLDIRAAAVSSLVQILEKPEGVDVDNIVDRLEEYAVPIAASFNERWPLNNERWGKVEETGGDTQEFSTDMSDVERPIRDLLYRARDCQMKLPQWKDNWADTLEAKRLQLSIKNTKKWMMAFVRKYSTSSEDETVLLPIMPFDPSEIHLFLRQGNPQVQLINPLPLEVFEMIRNNTLLYLSPPMSATALKSIINKTPSLRKKSAAQHYMHLSVPSPQEALGRGAGTIIKLLNEPRSYWREAPQPGNTTIPHVKDFVLEVADILVANCQHDALTWLIETLTHVPEDDGWTPTSEIDSMATTRQHNSFPLVHKIIEDIESRRNDPAWQRDPKRKPRTLPDTFTMRLNLLVTRSSWKSAKTFAHQVTKMIDLLLASTEPYHRRWDATEKAMLLRAGKQGCSLHVAAELADANLATAFSLDARSEPELQQQLRLELVLGLIRQDLKLPHRHASRKAAKNISAEHTADSKVIEKVRDLLLGLADSPIEYVREAAKRLVDTARNASKSKEESLWRGLDWPKRIGEKGVSEDSQENPEEGSN
ncbi:hypothetical protein QBC35DRAFT_536534 [Podospora australis]|uniref:Uncharacterized protein n=1 Tax=Podospora australis TaxID=1536484 RepID=A0AAN7ADT4_9PEZI|nr:hypothetical protein QBC35DRAFT_536534 [Podospora australis]